MLRNIKLKNFKCFEQLDLDCRPLNLLCGLNGTGKSSVLQALLMLRQSFETRELLRGLLVLSGERIDLGQSEDVLFEDAGDYVGGFALQDDGTVGDWEQEFVLEGVTGQVRTGISSRHIDQLLVRIDSVEGPTWNDFWSNLKSLGNLKEVAAQLDSAERPTREERAAIRRVLMIRGSLTDEEYRTIHQWMNELPKSNEAPSIDYVPAEWRKVSPFGGKLVYVDAERVGPRKSYPLSDVKAWDSDFGASSEYAWNYLNHHQNEPLAEDDPRCVERGRRRLLDVVDQWLQDVSPGAHLQLGTVMDAGALIAQFSFDQPRGGRQGPYHATNVGFGLSYALPVLLALLAEPGTLCLIENPESHLHPRGQTKLGELAARAAKAGVQMLVETHSDHFMDGVRIAVRDGLIEPEDVAFHYFERQGGKSVVSSPQVDTDGRLSEWPAGFFDQHGENLARLLAPRS